MVSKVTGFCYACSLILIDFLQIGKTITGKYYASLLERLREEIKKIDCILRIRWFIFTRECTIPFVCDNDIKNVRIMLRNISTSPTFQTQQFQNVKKCLAKRDNNKCIDKTSAYFEDFAVILYTSYFTDEIEKLEKYWS